MPVRTPFGRTPPNPIQTQLKTPISASSGKDSFPSAGPGAHDDTVVPSYHEARSRTVVLCFDGTGDQFNTDNSNIVNFFSMLKKDDKSQQLVYYQAGIGTYTIPDIATPLVAKWKKTIDMAIGNHLDAHVMGGYEFLMEQYHAEDKICIFGFSRGAYTARALAGMIHKVGLLPAGNHQQVPFAYKMFSRDDKKGWDQSDAFKKAFSIDIEIEFVGGYRLLRRDDPTHLPFTSSNTAIRYFRHAISLDERRAKFKANHYHKCHHNDQKGTKSEDMPRSNHRHPHFTAIIVMTIKVLMGPLAETNVREVWFAGCHCDVGGGSVKNDTPHSLARISLRWIIRECFRANTEIQFYGKSLKASA
ncbi:hypothetical protein EI94DRAFT_1794529 [Lactarius quietus]|nr:hypothetical protein EI94DRAFT_1794529 [Lactarius quietus]